MKRERIDGLIERLREAEAPVRILRQLSWPPEVREDFFARGADALPDVAYPRFDPQPTLAALGRFRQSLGTPDDAISA